MKIDEYAPAPIPTIRAKAKSFSVSPPKRYSVVIGSSVMKVVASERADRLPERDVRRSRGTTTAA